MDQSKGNPCTECGRELGFTDHTQCPPGECGKTCMCDGGGSIAHRPSVKCTMYYEEFHGPRKEPD